tara:strand:- start:144 stop:494 length:351 start_codon:yes stop_codon:yes gene_type:complete
MSSDASSEQRYTGQIKWFNNKAGYGFITVTQPGEYVNKDIFTHFSSIDVTNSQYKYLVQGEYVEFNIMKSSTEKHEFQSTNISGINGGRLMCETRKLMLSERKTRKDTTPVYTNTD